MCSDSGRSVSVTALVNRGRGAHGVVARTGRATTKRCAARASSRLSRIGPASCTAIHWNGSVTCAGRESGSSWSSSAWIRSLYVSLNSPSVRVRRSRMSGATARAEMDLGHRDAVNAQPSRGCSGDRRLRAIAALATGCSSATSGLDCGDAATGSNAQRSMRPRSTATSR